MGKFLKGLGGYLVGGPTGAFIGSQQKGARSSTVGSEWQAGHSVDPNTGEILGAPGAIPQEVGMDVQAQHERGVWNQKNRLGQSASQWAQGALGLLQSYRPGGGATLESGVYQGLANIDLQRSQMLQPLDLLGPYREEQARKARRATEKAGYISAIGGIAGTILGAAVGVPSLNLSLQKGAPGQQGPAPSGPGRGQIPGGYEEGGAGGAAAGYAGQAFQNPGFGQAMGQISGQGGAFGSGSSGGGGATGSWGGAAQSTLAPGAGGPGPGGPAGGPGGAHAPGGPGGGGAGQPRRGGPSGGPGAGPGSSGGGAPPSVGADGNFEPLAWAAKAAADPGPMGQIQQLHLSGYVAHLIESDPAWHVLDVAYQQEVAARVS